MSAFIHEASRAARFLRERRRFVPRASDVYIASYPRSGTTWTQYLVWLIATEGGEAEGDPSAPPPFDHLANVTPWFERDLALGRRDAAELEAMPSPRIFKTHLPAAWMPRAGRTIYLVREPDDVAVSYFHLYSTHLGFTGTFEEFFARFLAGDLQYRSWFKHTVAWRRAAARDERILVVAYERMHADLRETAVRVARHLALPLCEAALQRICARASFPAMKRHEDRFDHATAEGAAATRSFLRQGRTREGKHTLTPEMARALDERRRRALPLARFEIGLIAFLQ